MTEQLSFGKFWELSCCMRLFWAEGDPSSAGRGAPGRPFFQLVGRGAWHLSAKSAWVNLALAIGGRPHFEFFSQTWVFWCLRQIWFPTNDKQIVIRANCHFTVYRHFHDHWQTNNCKACNLCKRSSLATPCSFLCVWRWRCSRRGPFWLLWPPTWGLLCLLGPLVWAPLGLLGAPTGLYLGGGPGASAPSAPTIIRHWGWPISLRTTFEMLIDQK